jgi:hypothetical protein
MNAKQRQILSDWYKEYLNCCDNSDIAGFTTDARYKFIELSKTDPKLKKMLDNIYEGFFDEFEK